MIVLVAGGAGFIGSHYIRHRMTAHPEDRIICLDKLTYAGNLSSLAFAMDRQNFRFVMLDICDRSGVRSLFAEETPDIVVNFAAESHVDQSIQTPEIFLKTNLMGAGVLMDACREYGVSRYHQVSTDEVYGDLPLDRPDLLFTEESLLHPSSPYSASKASADLLAMSYCRTYSLPVTISRCSNNYGPWQHPEKLIPRMILLALEGEYLPVYGDGNNVRDWVHVKDHCRAIDLVIDRGRAGEIYNIGGACEKRNIDVIRMICRELDVPFERAVSVADRKGHDRRYALSITKISCELGWKPETPFPEGLRETIAWYCRHRDQMAPRLKRF